MSWLDPLKADAQARKTGAVISPLFAGSLCSRQIISVPFFLAGGLKIIYDMLLYRAFAGVRPPDGAVNATFRSATGKSKAG
jgi:hypothetical protein